MAIEQRTTWKSQVSKLGSALHFVDFKSKCRNAWNISILTSNLLCSKKDTKGIIRTNRPLNTEDSVEVLQQSY